MTIRLNLFLATILFSLCSCATLFSEEGLEGRVETKPEFRKFMPPTPDEAGLIQTDLSEVEAIRPESFQQSFFKGTESPNLLYRIHAPAELEPNTRYPLIVVLHGSDEMGADGVSHITNLPKSLVRASQDTEIPVYILAPQVPLRSAVYNNSPEDPDRASIAGPSLPTLIQLIEYVKKRLPVDPRRISVVGFSMGGSAAWQLIANRPDLFSAAAPISAVPPLKNQWHKFRFLPIWMIHGNRDRDNQIDQTRSIYESFSSDRYTSVRFFEFEGVGHDIPLRVLTEDTLFKWLVSHTK